MLAKKAKIYYYTTVLGKNPVKDFLQSLEKPLKAKVFRIFSIIEVYGIEMIPQHTKKLSGLDLWEIKILGRNNIRIFYLIPKENYILVLHGFIKKTDKTPEKEIAVALRRYEDWKIRQFLDK